MFPISIVWLDSFLVGIWKPKKKHQITFFSVSITKKMFVQNAFCSLFTKYLVVCGDNIAVFVFSYFGFKNYGYETDFWPGGLDFDWKRKRIWDGFFFRYTDKMRNIFVGTRETDMSDFVLATLLEYESIFFNMDYEKLQFFSGD